MKRTSCSRLFWCVRLRRSQSGCPDVAGAGTPYRSRPRATRKPRTITSMTARTTMSVTRSIAFPSASRRRSLGDQLTVLALEEEQGASAPHLGVLHLADVDHVVAALVRLDDPALDLCERALEHRNPIRVDAVGQAAELLPAGLGEMG